MGLDLRGFDRLPNDATVRVVPIPGGLTEEAAKPLLAVLAEQLAEWRRNGAIRDGAAALVAGGYFLLVAYVPSSSDLSGCTKDSLTRVLLSFESILKTPLLNAPRFAVESGDGVDFLTLAEYRARLQSGEVGAGSVVFDHLVQTLGEVRAGRLRTTAGESWYARVKP